MLVFIEDVKMESSRKFPTNTKTLIIIKTPFFLVRGEYFQITKTNSFALLLWDMSEWWWWCNTWPPDSFFLTPFLHLRKKVELD